MQTVLIEIKNNSAFEALQALEHQNVIRIMNDDAGYSSFALQGEQSSIDDFIKWIHYAENSPTVSLIDAKKQWNEKKNRLQKIIQ